MNCPDPPNSVIGLRLHDISLMLKGLSNCSQNYKPSRLMARLDVLRLRLSKKDDFIKDDFKHGLVVRVGVGAACSGVGVECTFEVECTANEHRAKQHCRTKRAHHFSSFSTASDPAVREEEYEHQFSESSLSQA